MRQVHLLACQALHQYSGPTPAQIMSPHLHVKHYDCILIPDSHLHVKHYDCILIPDALPVVNKETVQQGEGAGKGSMALSLGIIVKP